MEGTWPVFKSRELQAVSGAPLIRLLSALIGLIRVGILLESKSYPCRSVTTATFDWLRPRKPEHCVLSVKACHLSVIGGANRGHLPLRVSLRLDLPSIGPARV